MFGAKYSRLKFWIISICLFIPAVIINVFVRALENSENNQNSLIVFFIINFIIVILWLNTLANRIRDYGSNPWISLWAFIPLGNLFLALFYGSVKYKNKPEKTTPTKSNVSSLTKAVYNHSKDIASEIKPTINEYKEKHSSSNQTTNQLNNIDISNEDEIYEKIMLEIEEDKKVKSTWGRALANSDGDKDKAESLYINMRHSILSNKTCDNRGNKKSKEGTKELNHREKEFLIKNNCNENSINVNIEKNIIRIRKKKVYICLERKSYIEIQIPSNEFDMINTIHENVSKNVERIICPFCNISNSKGREICFKCKKALTVNSLIIQYKNQLN